MISRGLTGKALMKTVMLGGAGRSAARGRMSPACPWDGRKAEAAPGSPGHVSRRTTRRTRAVRGSALPGAGAGDGPRLRFLRGPWAPPAAPAPVTGTCPGGHEAKPRNLNLPLR